MSKLLMSLLTVAVAVVVVIVALAATASPAAAQIAKCGMGTAQVRQTTSLARAEDYRQHLPAAPDLPELDGKVSPAVMAIFDGPITFPTVGLGQPKTYASAVCIVVDGEPFIYPELDTSGMTP